MNILLYRDAQTEYPDWLPQLAARLSGVASCELVQQYAECVSRLRSPEAGIAIVVAQIDSQDELRDFVNAKNVFERRHLILILPDSASETVSLCHRLHPRYMMLPGTPWEWLEAVILQMLQESAPRQATSGSPK